ncbi:unnamed protein product [Arctogadus glacialis]
MCSSLNVLVSGQKEFKMLYNFLVREHIFSKTDIDTTSLNPFNIFLYIRRRGKEREMAKEATEGQVTRKREKKKTEEATEQLKEREEATEGQVTRKREKATEQLKESEEATEGQVTREREKKETEEVTEQLKESEEATEGQVTREREKKETEEVTEQLKESEEETEGQVTREREEGDRGGDKGSDGQSEGERAQRQAAQEAQMTRSSIDPCPLLLRRMRLDRCRVCADLTAMCLWEAGHLRWTQRMFGSRGT